MNQEKFTQPDLKILLAENNREFANVLGICHGREEGSCPGIARLSRFVTNFGNLEQKRPGFDPPAADAPGLPFYSDFHRSLFPNLPYPNRGHKRHGP
jgi:hypothetical protein